MIKKLAILLFIACLSFVFVISLSYAKDKDKSQNKDRPPGWDQEKRKAGNLTFLRDKTKKRESKREKEINLKVSKTKRKMQRRSPLIR